MKYTISALCASFIFAGTAMAAQPTSNTGKMIQVSVFGPSTAAAVGFNLSYPNSAKSKFSKNYGSRGTSYQGQPTPAGYRYSFGFRNNTIFSSGISCGSAILTQSATVQLVFKNNKCSFKILKKG